MPEPTNLLIKQMKIMLPVSDKEIPDFSYMELCAKMMMLKKYRDYLAFLETHVAHTS